MDEYKKMSIQELKILEDKHWKLFKKIRTIRKYKQLEEDNGGK